MFRQGDILIKPVDALPPDASPAPPDARGRVVLALGTATGHAHAFNSGASMFHTPDGARFIQIADTGADLVHDEHATIPVPAGVYAVIRQREYHPEAIRQVED